MAHAEERTARGWLLVLSRVLIIWEPLEFAVAAFGAINAIEVRGLPVAFVLLMRLAATALSVAAGRALYDRNSSGPRLATVALALTGATRLFAYLTPYFPSNRLPGQTSLYVAAVILYYGGSLAYLAWSKQVRAIRSV